MSISDMEVDRVLTSIGPLMRGELGTIHAELRGTLHRAHGRVFDVPESDPDYEAKRQAFIDSCEHIDLGVLSRRKVTGAFVTNLVANMCGTASDISQYKFHDAGTGTTAEANTDTGLETAISTPTTRATGDQTAGGTATAPTYTTEATLGPLPTATITEHIVCTTAARTTTEILDRSVFSASPINAVAGDFWTASYTATFSAEA